MIDVNSMMNTLEAIVTKVLIKNSESRNNDFILIAEVLHETNPEVGDMAFNDVMLHNKELNIPNFESITRARRRIQEENPWLQAIDSVQEGRAESESAFHERYSPGK